MKWFSLLLIMSLLTGMLLSVSSAVYADDSHSDNSSTVIDIGISGNLKADISASGPAELNVEAQGPAQVSIDAGDEVKLNVKASDESQILIEEQGIDEPTRQQETEYDNPATDLNSSLQPNDPVVGSGNQVTIMLAASAIVAGLVAFFLIGRFIYRKRSERKIK
jgi:hypothetical protein